MLWGHRVDPTHDLRSDDDRLFPAGRHDRAASRVRPDEGQGGVRRPARHATAGRLVLLRRLRRRRPAHRPGTGRWPAGHDLAGGLLAGAGHRGETGRGDRRGCDREGAGARRRWRPLGGHLHRPRRQRPGAGSGPVTAACTRGSNGRPVHCPGAVPATKLPAGAKNQATVTQAVTDPAPMVDTRTWTTGGGNTFPGAEVPFGMVQWSPDTMPTRNAGGGYSFGDSSITGYSLTHISGPGCGAAGDVPMLPITGTLPGGNPNAIMTPFTNNGEVAQAGYYSAQTNQPNTITSEFTATAHSSMGRFTYPATTQAGFLIKLRNSQNGQFAPSTAQILGSNEVSGSQTSGHFCGEVMNDNQRQEYTVHFDITFDQPFSSSQIIKAANGTPSAVYVTFNTTGNAVVQAKLGISYVSDDNARLNWQTDNAGWNFGNVKSAAQDAWNKLLGRIQVAGGSFAQTQQFYSNLYKAFIQPNITSDVNGQYMGADVKVHTIGAGQHDQYGVFSG